MGRCLIRRTKRFASWAAAAGLCFAALPAAAGAPAPARSSRSTPTRATPKAEPRSCSHYRRGLRSVVWESYGSSGTDTSFRSIQGQRYASDGSKQGAQFQVNTFTTSYQYGPAVSVAANGSFVVVWSSSGSSGTDTSFRSVQGQRFASDGSAQGAQFQVNTYTTDTQYYPSVAAAPDGDFVVVWESSGSVGSDTGLSIQGQRYASDGSPQGAQFQVNAYTTSDQSYPFVTATPTATSSSCGPAKVRTGRTRVSGASRAGVSVRMAPRRVHSSRSTLTRRTRRNPPR